MFTACILEVAPFAQDRDPFCAFAKTSFEPVFSGCCNVF